MTDPLDIHAFAVSLGNAIDVEVAARPGITVLHVCGVIGAAAGVSLGQALPTTSAEIDDCHLGVMVQAFRSALIEIRDKGRLGVN